MIHFTSHDINIFIAKNIIKTSISKKNYVELDEISKKSEGKVSLLQEYDGAYPRNLILSIKMKKSVFTFFILQVVHVLFKANLRRLNLKCTFVSCLINFSSYV